MGRFAVSSCIYFVSIESYLMELDLESLLSYGLVIKRSSGFVWEQGGRRVQKDEFYTQQENPVIQARYLLDMFCIFCD